MIASFFLFIIRYEVAFSLKIFALKIVETFLACKLMEQMSSAWSYAPQLRTKAATCKMKHSNEDIFSYVTGLDLFDSDKLTGLK